MIIFYTLCKMKKALAAVSRSQGFAILEFSRNQFPMSPILNQNSASYMLPSSFWNVVKTV